jgi:hypothetical protein
VPTHLHLKGGSMINLFICGLIGSLNTAYAQDYDDLDESEDSKTRTRKSRTIEIDQNVREITRGWYAKSGVGGGLYLGKFSGALQPGAAIYMGLGQDFIDQEKSSASWEVAFGQGIHNGTFYEEQALQGGPFVQGDTRTYGILAVMEYSRYPSRRIGLGIRAGGGVMFAPLLMDEAYYIDEVVSKSWGGINPTYHSSPHPVALGGPTFEYYTKLAHFSVGVDADVFYAIGFDLGANIIGNLKYTF